MSVFLLKKCAVNQNILRHNAVNPVVLFCRNYQWKTGTYGCTPKNPPQPSTAPFEPPDQLNRLHEAYRIHGHKKAKVNPVPLSDVSYVPELDVQRYALSTDEVHHTKSFLHGKNFLGNLKDAASALDAVYSGNVGLEFMHLEEESERVWFQQEWEQLSKESVPREVQIETATELIKSQVLDRFLAIKFVSLKRYGAEGCESQMTFFQEFFRFAAENDVQEIILGAQHRGRLNILIDLLNMPAELLFRKLSGKSELPDTTHKFMGDVISHLCPSATLNVGGKPVHVQMSNVPSHLEVVCAVSAGETRGWQQVLGDGEYSTKPKPCNQVLNVQIHGDGSFMGQGITLENLVGSMIPHFSVGGSVHLIVNNQLGFTTPPQCGRGTRYASDAGKVISAPVIHVNGEFPDELTKATKLACRYLKKFRKNVIIDLICYRKRGHNELDDPTFTSPLLYKVINSRPTIPDLYTKNLIDKGIMSSAEVEEIAKKFHSSLTASLENVSSFLPTQPDKPLWAGFTHGPHALTTWDTGVDTDLLKLVASKSVEFPEDFSVHPTIVKNHAATRKRKVNNDLIDWATAEAMAMGSLLYNGYNVRLSGEDVGRGTFSHRHAMIVEQNTDDIYIPLNNISKDQVGHLEIANSHLSEEAVLAFEYGFSVVNPNTLVIWEAQFGDFFNGAQIVIDTYVASGEAKWATMSGMTMLLPHGFDGAGPEHSSCRIERFLQLSDSSEVRPDGEDVNIQFANPTTPAQYFHLLRRQMVRNYRKPLIVAAPKLLLRAADALSSLDDMGPGTSFLPVIGDSSVTNPSDVRRIIFTSGKHYYELRHHKETNNLKNVAIVRVEELSPFPTQQLQTEIAKYKNAKEFIWSQEEPQNAGGWSFCKPRFENLVGCRIKYAGREASAAAAVGINEIHKKEVKMIVETPFK